MSVIPEGRAKGGKARAEKLTGAQRSEIARQAAKARWDSEIPEAICGSPDSPLQIGGEDIQCYVLEGGTRVLTQASFLEAIGRHRKANVRREGGEERIPAILQGKSIKPFITQEILEKSRPIKFRNTNGGMAYGYRAELLPDVCEIYLKARDAGVLPQNQKHVAIQADILIRGLARVGIIAMVDEATGYQSLRAKDALSKILEAFIATEIQPWLSTFPSDFYAELFRLRGLEYPKDSVQRPQYFGILTNDIVYKRLAPGVLKELKDVSPRNEQGHLKHKYFQKLTQNIGYPKLREHLGSVVAIMKLSKDYQDFLEKLDSIHTRYGDTLPLPLDYDARNDDGRGI